MRPDAFAFSVAQLRQLSQLVADLPLRKAQLIKLLQVEPVFPAGAEPVAKSERCIRGHAALRVDDLSNAVHRNLDLTRQLGCADSEFLELFGEMLAGVDRSAGHECLPMKRARASVVIAAFYTMRACCVAASSVASAYESETRKHHHATT